LSASFAKFEKASLCTLRGRIQHILLLLSSHTDERIEQKKRAERSSHILNLDKRLILEGKK
jgi:hypothetical protein